MSEHSSTPGFCASCGMHNYGHDPDCQYHPKNRPIVTVTDPESQDGVERIAMTEFEVRMYHRSGQYAQENTRRAALQFAVQLQRPDSIDLARAIRDAHMIYTWEMTGEVPDAAGALHNLKVVN